MKKKLSLREDVTTQAGPLQVDRAAGIVHDVKLLGLESRNGRRYLHEALSKALPLYQDAKCNLDHPDGQQASRRFSDRFGRFRNVRLAADGFRADFHYNAAHPFAETFAWWAENDPGAVGFSHNATGSGEPDEQGTFVVSEIHEVHSIDLVADPATTNGLFESSMDPTLDTPVTDNPAAGADAGDWKAKVADAIKDLVTDDSKSADEKWAAIEQLFDACHPEDDDADDSEVEEDDEEGDGDMEEDDTEEDDECYAGGKKMESLRKLAAKNPSVRWLLGRHDAYQVKEQLARKTAKARKLCEAAALPASGITDVFIEQLVCCKDDRAMQRLIDDRRKLLASSPRKKPTSAAAAGSDVTFDQFMAGLKQ